MGLPFLDQLAKAVELALDLVDDRCAARVLPPMAWLSSNELWLTVAMSKTITAPPSAWPPLAPGLPSAPRATLPMKLEPDSVRLPSAAMAPPWAPPSVPPVAPSTRLSVKLLSLMVAVPSESIAPPSAVPPPGAKPSAG